MRVIGASFVVAAAAALPACHSPIAAWDESGPPEDPQRVGAGVHGWPLYERAPQREGVRTDVLWPLTSVLTDADGGIRHADVVFPVFRYDRDGTRSRLGVRPLFDVETDLTDRGEVEDVDLLFPLVKWRDAPGESRFEVRPLWFSGHEGEEKEWTAFFPFGASWRNPQGGGWWAGPFAFGGWEKGTTRGTWYGWGLASREEDDAKHAVETNALFGALQRRSWDDGSSWRAFPLAGGSEDASERSSKWHVVWPGLVRHAREGETTTDWALPLWYREAGAASSTSLLVPFWFQHESPESSTKILFPLYGATHERDLDRTYLGGNLLWLTQRPDGGGVDVLFPLLHYSAQGDDWNGWLFPVLWTKQEADRGHWHLWPLFGTSWKGATTKRSVAWPFFTHESAPNGWVARLPAPIVKVDRQGPEHGTTVFPLFDHTSHADTGAYDGDLLLLLSQWESDGKGTSDFRVLWRLLQSTETPERSVVALNPLFRHETNVRGDDHWSALFGLCARTREADDVRWRFLWFVTM
jgi:hypothetical protein